MPAVLNASPPHPRSLVRRMSEGKWEADTFTNTVWFNAEGDGVYIQQGHICLACSPIGDGPPFADPMDDPVWDEQQERLAAWLNHIAPDGVIPVVPGGKEPTDV